MKSYRGWLVVFCALLTTFWIAGATMAQVKKGKTRPALTKHLMAGLVKANASKVKMSLQAGVKGEKAWAALEIDAALLSEASFLLMDDGRCPDGTWKEACLQMQYGSTALLASIKKKDVKGSQAALRATMKACGTCHKAHKKK